MAARPKLKYLSFTYAN